MVKCWTVAVAAVLLVGCAHSARGLVRVEDGQAVVESLEGRRLWIRDEGEGAWFPALVDCEVDLRGRGSRRNLAVVEWEVLAGPTGGQPFVGRLGLGRGGLVLDDRSTGQQVLLEAQGAEALLEHVGRMVLVEGYVSGPQQVRVVDWRSLEP